jgi:hypothetical protein
MQHLFFHASIFFLDFALGGVEVGNDVARGVVRLDGSI